MKLMNDWILVKMEPIPEKIGSIIAVHGDRVRIGTVLDVGPGLSTPKTGRRIPVGVEKGERIAFFRENLEHQQGKQIIATLKELGDDMGLIRAPDVLFAIAKGVDVRVSA